MQGPVLLVCRVNGANGVLAPMRGSPVRKPQDMMR
jgi:hypothetical protein